ncbi:MAG TPA: GntG family PLP-dependent aldolase [Candidatus Limnocylindrales bacterium]|nr:GntG family PLP-dependent aldolase [Candidatus Limnocylindrales bacterium]
MTDRPAPIDLRSDTVTRPTPGMREAMARADVGDDQFGEDPSINRLQERVAAMLGHEAALWFPTGTMANQVAIRTLTRPGDEVLAPREAHILWHETGAAAANSGVQVTEIGPAVTTGRFTADEFLAARKPRGHMLLPPTTVVDVENTHNRAGGVVIDVATSTAIADAARANDVTSFLDGARLWNAAVALGVDIAELARPFDVVNVAFSKGLGAPGGSLLAGSRAFVAAATRYRRMAGGAMRQVGIFAAAAEFALDHHIDRLAEDHANAHLLADRLAASPAIELDPAAVQTNIVVFRLADGAPDAPTVVAAAREAGVLVVAFSAGTIRAVTHLDVTRAEVADAAELLVAAAESDAPG